MKISIKIFYVIVISLVSVFQLINVYDCFGQKSQAREELDVDPIDNQILSDLIYKSDKELHLILIYTDWCEPCTPELHKIDSAFSSISNMEIYYIYPDKISYKELVIKYLRKNGIDSRAFILSDKYKGNVKKRFVRFRDEICENCDDILGFPSVVLLNKEYEVVYKHTGKNDLSEIIEIIR